MKTTNKWVAIMLLVVGTLFTACSKDDNNGNNNTENSLLLGEWRAATISYDAGVHSGTYPFDHPTFKQGCGTDYISISANYTVSLKENNKVEGDCIDQVSLGTWTEGIITVKGAERQIFSVSETELVLIYDLNFMGQTLPITVTYVKGEPEEIDPVVGEWKAETISYDAGVHSGTYPFDHPTFKQGCGTDYITINANNTVSLKENNKVGDDCEDQISNGTWTEGIITVKGAEREISSVSETELVLVYDLAFMGQTLPITVTYSKQ